MDINFLKKIPKHSVKNSTDKVCLKEDATQAIKGDGKKRLIQAIGLPLCSYVLIILVKVVYKASFERNSTLVYPRDTWHCVNENVTA
ncbi:unnamed protein product [Dovyalis caffra]|uniref:Uncharacterized protein n=1 Tax=Dovyalis caffra TaxID=77055 RepID=A0AAV1S626_9ROSI|nr:unnamed protein product [Dovyalis caffra]